MGSNRGDLVGSRPTSAANYGQNLTEGVMMIQLKDAHSGEIIYINPKCIEMLKENKSKGWWHIHMISGEIITITLDRFLQLDLL